MKNINKKIIRRFSTLVSAVIVSAAAVFFSYRHMENQQVLPVFGNIQKDKPVIILDAGHGEST